MYLQYGRNCGRNLLRVEDMSTTCSFEETRLPFQSPVPSKSKVRTPMAVGQTPEPQTRVG